MLFYGSEEMAVAEHAEPLRKNLINTARQNLITDLDGTASAGLQKAYFLSSNLPCVTIHNEQTAAGGGRQNWQWK